MSAPALQFRAMGCDVRVAGATAGGGAADPRPVRSPRAPVQPLLDGSELNAVNGRAGRAIRVSRAFADMLELVADGRPPDRRAGRPHDRLRPAGGRLRPRLRRRPRRDPRLPVRRPSRVRQRAGCTTAVARASRRRARSERRRQGADRGRRACAASAAKGSISAGGDVAARGAVDVALPGGGAVRLESRRPCHQRPRPPHVAPRRNGAAPSDRSREPAARRGRAGSR